MINLVTASLFFLAAGIFTSVTILSAYQILFAIPLIYFLLQTLRKKEFKLPSSAWFLALFIAAATLSLFLNLELIPKPSKNFGRLKYFLFGIGGIFVLKVWVKEASDRVKKFLTNTFLLSVVVAGLFAVYQFSISIDGRAKSLTDTMRYGYGTGMALLIILTAILQQEKINTWFNWKAGTIAFVIGFIGMYLTYTRGALLGFFCGLPLVLYYYRAKLGLLFGALAGVLVLTLVSFYLFGSGNYNSRFLINKNNSSDVIRRSQWNAAIIATKERPLLGWGLSNFHSQLKRIKHENDLDAKDYDDAHSHNLFLEISSGVGLIGLAFFLAWLISWAIECFKAGGLKRAFIIPFGVAFIVSSQFEVTFDANNASMIFFLYGLSNVK